MSRSTTPTYVVEVVTPGYRWSPAAWDCKRSGRPNDARLAEYVASFEQSTQPGGCNAHLGTTIVTRAWVRRNSPGGDKVASYQAALFTVVTP